MDEAAVLTTLLEAYSPSGREADAVCAFTQVARSMGYASDIDGAGNGLARRGHGRPQILFLGHIDTVDGFLPVRVHGGRIAGRGACDAKGALAAALVAARGWEGPGEILVAAAVGEELDSRGARYLIPRHRPDALLVGEPSGWSGITVGYKGNLSVEVAIEGRRSHLASPAPTTVESALDLVARLRGFCEARRGPTPFASVTAKVHSIETRRLDGRELVTVGVNVRVPPGRTTADVLAFLESQGEATVCRVVDRSEPVLVDPRSEVVRALCAGIRGEGGRPTLLRKSGTSDLNLSAPAWRCPAAVYGPGDSHLDHTDREALDLEDLRKSVRVLEIAFARIADRSEGMRTGDESRVAAMRAAGAGRRRPPSASRARPRGTAA